MRRQRGLQGPHSGFKESDMHVHMLETGLWFSLGNFLLLPSIVWHGRFLIVAYSFPAYDRRPSLFKPLWGQPPPRENWRCERLERYFVFWQIRAVQTDLLGLLGIIGVECWHIQAVRTDSAGETESTFGKAGRYGHILW